MKRIHNLSLPTGALACLSTLVPLLQAQNVAITPTPADFQNSQLGHWLVGIPFDAKFSHNGGAVCGATIQATSVPSGFQWTSNGSSGELTGVFGTAGKYSFTLKLICPYSLTSGNYTVYVNGPMSMVSGPYLASGNVGVAFYTPLTQGGAPNFSGQVVSGSLPPGCALWGATYEVLVPSPAEFLNCVPTTQGAYSFQVSVTDGLGETGTQSYNLLIGPPGVFYTSTNILGFSGIAGGAPQTQSLGVSTTDLSIVNYTVTSDATWLTATPASGPTPGSLTVQMDPSKLPAGVSQGHLTVAPNGGKQPETVTVVADLQTPQPLIATAPESAEVDLSPVPNAPRTYQLGFHVWNDGTGALTAKVSAAGNWLSVQPGQISLTPGQMQALTVNIDATYLTPGIYQGSIILQSSGQGKIVPVNLVVPTPNYTPGLSVQVLGFGDWLLQGLAGVGIGAGNTQEIAIVNTVPQAPMDWTATLAGFANTAHLTSTSGHLDAGQASATIGLAYDFNNLGVGRHEGLLQVTAPGATGSPASVRLGVDVVPRAMSNGPNIAVVPLDVQIDTPAIVVPPGSTTATAHLQIVNPSNIPVSFTVTSPSSAVTFDTPAGVAGVGSPTTVQVTVDNSGGPITYEQYLQIYVQVAKVVGGGYNATLNNPMIEYADGYGSFVPEAVSPRVRPEAAGCTPARIHLVPSRPSSYLTLLADWQVNVAAVAYDDCGNPLSEASVSASFSNGDTALALPIQDATKGLYQGTWIPGSTGSATITLRASKGSLTPATAQIFDSVIEDTGATVISNGGIVNTANPGAPAIVGKSITISGANLGTAASGTTVLIGGIQAQLYSVSPSQIVAQIPPSLAPNARYEVVVLAGNSVSTPKPVIVGAAPSIPAPSAVGPNWGSGTSGTFTFTFSDSAGWQSLTVLDVLINNVLDGRQACYVAFVPSGANSGSVYLVDNAGDAGGPYSGMVLPGSGTVSNGQCSIAGAGSSVAGSGNTLTLTLAITFSASFAGNKVMYVAAQDASANSGWQPLGCWDAPGPAVSGPAAGGVSPAHTTGMGPATYTFTFTDTNGWQDISVANILIASAINGVGACYVAFVPSGAGAGSVYLVDDAGDAAGPYSGMVLPGSGTVHNSQCSIAGTGSSLTASGNTLTLTLAVTFSSTFTGNRIVYLAAGSSKQNSGWQAMGMAAVQ